MVSLYDEILIREIELWTKNTDIHVYGDEEATMLFTLRADANGDKPLELPILALKRVGGYKVLNVNSAPPTRNSYTIMHSNTAAIQLNCIPIEISYQLDVYTRYKKEADAYVRDLIFNIVNHPTYKVAIPYNDTKVMHHFNLTLGETVEDNSSVPESLVKGTFTRMTVGISIKDAYLWSVPIHGIVRMSDGIWIVPDGDDKQKEQVII